MRPASEPCQRSSHRTQLFVPPTLRQSHGIADLYHLPQLAGGPPPGVVVFDVQTLLTTTQGKEIVETELRPLLEDPTICKVEWGGA